jgi:hypothetical protein
MASYRQFVGDARRLVALLALVSYFVSSLLIGANALVLCRGADGHVAIETGLPSAGTKFVREMAAVAEVAAAGRSGHHLAPCFDVNLTSASKAPSIGGFFAPPMSAPVVFLPVVYDTQNLQVDYNQPAYTTALRADPTLLALRTIVLLI